MLKDRTGIRIVILEVRFTAGLDSTSLREDCDTKLDKRNFFALIELEQFFYKLE